MNCKITNNSDMNIDQLSPLIDDLASHVKNVMKIKSMPAVTLQEDADNADVILGKTAYYDPQNKVVTVYVTNRHPKDIMRSISHEFVHHAQNERGEFDNVGAMGEGYAQNDEHLRNMEKEAYLKGNMCFRDWEDGYKRQMMESIHRQNSFKRRNNTMKIHKWKNNELNRLLMEKFNFGTNTLLEGSCSANRDGKEDEECPKCGEKHATHSHDDKKEEVNEVHCDSKGNREDEEKVEEKKMPMHDHDDDPSTPEVPAFVSKEEDAAAKKKGKKGEQPKHLAALQAKKKGEKEDKKEKQEESFRDSVRKLMEEIIGLQ